MPSNGQFGFSVLVSGKTLPEYPHPEDKTRTLIESVLWSPVTYWMTVKEFCKASEEIEVQKWPVTPYEIKVCPVVVKCELVENLIHFKGLF